MTTPPVTTPPVTTPPVTTPPVTTTAPVTSPPVTTPPSSSETNVSRRPWLYSDAGSDGLVAEPRVLRRSGTSDFDEDLPLASDGEVNGGVIRRLREARGISLEDLAEQTHISKSYLKAIEEQNVDDLPARVYLRGFLTQIARVLRVDKKQLAEGYISFVGRFGK